MFYKLQYIETSFASQILTTTSAPYSNGLTITIGPFAITQSGLDQLHLPTHPRVGSIIDISTHGYADHCPVNSASNQAVSLMEGLQVQENSGQAAPLLQPLFNSGSDGASASFNTLSAAFAQMQMSSRASITRWFSVPHGLPKLYGTKLPVLVCFFEACGAWG
jgi:hypothetical protein